MSGASKMGGVGVPKRGPEFERKVPSSLQSPSESLAIPSNEAVQDANEIFRQGWQAIVGSLHAANQARDDASAADLLRAAGTPASIQEPAAAAANEGRAMKDTVERATGELVAEGASIAKSIAPRPAIVPKTSPVQAAVHARVDRPPTKGRAEEFASHAPQPSLRSDQSNPQQDIYIQSATVTATSSEFRIVQASAPKRAVSLITEETALARSSAAEFTNRKGNTSGPDAGLSRSANVSVPSSDPSLRSTARTPVDIKNEEQTATAIVSSSVSTGRTDRVLDGPSEDVITHKPTAVVEQAKSSTPDGPSLRLFSSGRSSAPLASKSPIKSADTTEITLDQGVQINQSSIGPLKKDAMRRDQASIAATPLNSKAKTAAAPFIQSQPVSDASAAAFGQTRGAPALPSSAPWTPPLSGLDANGMTLGKSAPAHEMFAAMDAGMNDGSARWIIADSHRAEAGFQDPALGWISVHAQAGVAGIHAAVMPSSETAAEVLSGHLAGLNAHMASHYEHMTTVTLSIPGTGWNSHDTGRELAQGNERSQGQDNRQQAQENSGSMKSEPVRQFTNGLQDERASTELPVFTAGMSLQERHFSVVV